MDTVDIAMIKSEKFKLKKKTEVELQKVSSIRYALALEWTFAGNDIRLTYAIE